MWIGGRRGGGHSRYYCLGWAGWGEWDGGWLVRDGAAGATSEGVKLERVVHSERGEPLFLFCNGAIINGYVT